MVFCVAVVFVCSSLFFSCCFGTHFKGGHFWFRSLLQVPNQVEIGLQLTWKMSYSSTTLCSNDAIDSGLLIGPETPGYVMCDVGCQGRVGDVSIRCLEYSFLEDWMTGDRAYNHTFQGNGSYQVLWDGEGWFKDNVPWQFRMTLNLRPRPRTGRVNSSPRAVLPPIPINVQRGCSTTIRITVVDDDGDVVRCRWAEARRQECGGVCHEAFGVGQPLVTLVQETCSLQLIPSQVPDTYILALQLEDFDPSDHLFQSPLSSVPLQFSVGLYSSNETETSSSSSNQSAAVEPEWCKMAPVFVAPTPDDGSCKTMDPNRNISMTVAAKAKDSVTVVFKIRSVGPVYGDVHQTEVASNGSVFYVIVSMAANVVSLEDRTFCFEATDNFGLVSNETCFNITFGLHPPQATSATYDSSMRRVIIRFSQRPIERPLVPKMVSIYDDKDQLVANYDTTATDQVTFRDNTISMRTTDQMVNNIGCYHILLQPGAVLDSCGTQSLEVANTTSLNFSTNPSVGGGSECDFTSATQKTTATMAATTDASSTGRSSSSTSSSSSSSGGSSSTVGASLENGSSSWDYRWLVIAVVCSVALFSIAALVIACVIRASKSRERDRRRRQERFFSTLNSRGIYNWTYDQQQQQQTKSAADTATTTDTTVHS